MATTEVRAVSPQPPEPSPLIPQRVKVTVAYVRNRYSEWNATIRVTHALPSVEEAIDLLPTNDRRKVHTLYNYRNGPLELLVKNTKGAISAKAWASAIARAIARGLEAPEQNTAELIAIKNGGFLTLGDMLFRLDAVDWIRTGSRALPALRRKVMDDVRTEADAIKRTANALAEKTKQEAREEYDRVTQNCAQIRSKHETMRKELQFLIPDWCRTPHKPISLMGSDQLVRTRVDIVFKWFEFKHKNEVYRLAAKAQPAMSFFLWVPINSNEEGYTMRISMDTALSGYLPHISLSGCMHLADAPRTINSDLSLRQLVDSISRTMETINCSSLLTAYKGWDKRIQELVPEGYIRIFQAHGDSGYDLCNELYAKLEEKKTLDKAKVPQEAATFTLAAEGSADATTIVPGKQEPITPTEEEEF